MTDVTRENFAEAMRKAVELRGEDYTYPEAIPYDGSDPSKNRSDDFHAERGECLYTDARGNPACIIGQALYLIDPALVPGNGVVAGASEVLGNLGNDDFGLAVACDRAQEIQDNDGTWGKALSEFEKSLANYGPTDEGDYGRGEDEY
jgi:hypothetical protein